MESVRANGRDDAREFSAYWVVGAELKKLSLLATKCIVLSNQPMTAKDMSKDNADEAYMAILIHEIILSSTTHRARYGIDLLDY
jgi:hypothetical protein